MSRTSWSAIRCWSAPTIRSARRSPKRPADDGNPDRMLDTKEFGDREQLPEAKDLPIDADYDNVYTGNSAGEGSADFGEPSGQANWRVGAGRGDFPRRGRRLPGQR